MAKKLLIVESPGKLKTLRKILGQGWLLEASVGHTTELAHDGPKKLGFELKGDQVLTRYVPRGTRGRQVLAKLRKAAQACEQVYLATDPDREGEAIAWHLVEQLKLKNFVRVSYTQITEAAVKAAIARPGRLNAELIRAQRARQCLDKLVGFELSPLLWSSTGGRSAGRVQSATLHLICERERERMSFVPENYWVLKSKYREGFEAVFEKAVAVPDEDPSHVPTETEARRLAEIARANPHIVREAASRPETRNPPPPLITSSLQQSAGGRFRYSPQKTMQIAQELYEGIGGKGLITYMRTDAITLSPEFTQEARAWLSENSPASLANHLPSYRSGPIAKDAKIAKGALNAQGAHEAIRPTSVALTPESAERELGLSPEQLNVYGLIWQRAIASQCRPASLSKTKIAIDCADTRWVARGTVITDPGYLKYWNNLEDESPLPTVRVGQRLDFKDVATEAKTTQPPSRYSEPKLVQLMEKKGIGRPSTYASTIATIKDRDYVVLDRSLLAPTPLGLACDEALLRAIPEMVDAAFTAQMERSLDDIAEGRLDWERYLTGWNTDYLVPALGKAREALKSVARVAAPRSFKRGKFGGKGGDGADSKKGGRRRTAKGVDGHGGVVTFELTGVASGEKSPLRSKRAKRGARKTASKSTRGAKRSASDTRASSADAQARLKAAAALARSLDRSPKCPDGHGELEPRLSKKGAVYWKCSHLGCDAFAWNQDFSDHPCPDCGAFMEKVPSAKVTGGYFLKCNQRDKHAEETVLFKSKRTEEWEKAR